MTKKLILLLIVFISFYANAQIKKGTILLGGQIAFAELNREAINNFPIPQANPFLPNDQSRNFNFGLSIGKAIKDNKVFGVNVNTGYSKQSFYYNLPEKGIIRGKSFEVGVFLRKYKMLIKDFYLFGQGSASVNTANSKYSFTTQNYNSVTKQFTTSLSFAPGVAYILSKKLHVELSMQNLVSIGYYTSKQEFNNSMIPTSKSNGFGLSSSLSNSVLGNLGIGFRIVL